MNMLELQCLYPTVSLLCFRLLMLAGIIFNMGYLFYQQIVVRFECSCTIFFQNMSNKQRNEDPEKNKSIFLYKVAPHTLNLNTRQSVAI